MLFNPDDIERWAGCRQQSIPIVKVETETQRQRRYKTAMKALERKGVRVAQKQREEVVPMT
jgi:hypothetical protein